ncbi:MAG: hypothetical protein FWD67_05340 [Betaproteobacteria bacterium]|nr:hypothetical protein [Betaproteobacteria bacterium]
MPPDSAIGENVPILSHSGLGQRTLTLHIPHGKHLGGARRSIAWQLHDKKDWYISPTDRDERVVSVPTVIYTSHGDAAIVTTIAPPGGGKFDTNDVGNGKILSAIKIGDLLGGTPGQAKAVDGHASPANRAGLAVLPSPPRMQRLAQPGKTMHFGTKLPT